MTLVCAPSCFICYSFFFRLAFFFFFFFNDTATTEIYTLSLHDALPICARRRGGDPVAGAAAVRRRARHRSPRSARRARCGDRKSTRLNSSHSQISYAVFCLKKKKKKKNKQNENKEKKKKKKRRKEGRKQ